MIGTVRLGLPVQALGAVGDDVPGRRLLRWLSAEGVDVQFLTKVSGKRTARVFVLTTSQGIQSFLGYHPPTNGPSSLPPAWQEAIQHGVSFYCDGWSCRSLGTTLVRQAMQTAKAAGVPVFFDPGPQVQLCAASQLADLLRETTVLMLTEEEARVLLPGALTLPDLASALQAYGPQLVVIKRGALGCLVQRGDEVVLHPGFTVSVRDTTAAGDAVSAAMLLGWLRHYELPQLAVLLNAAGAVAVQRLGGGFNMPRLAEIQALLQQHGRATDWM